uniref:Uncharacterized protein n=1 Tax=Gigaspora margarita TaxID=4874 RepID=A0A8H4EP92_GIGMA
MSNNSSSKKSDNSESDNSHSTISSEDETNEKNSTLYNNSTNSSINIKNFTVQNQSNITSLLSIPFDLSVKEIYDYIIQHNFVTTVLTEISNLKSNNILESLAFAQDKNYNDDFES